MAKIADMVDKVSQAVVSGYKMIENGVVSGYKKIENGAVSGFEKVSDKCVDVLFAHSGETVEDAKRRLQGKTCEKNENTTEK